MRKRKGKKEPRHIYKRCKKREKYIEEIEKRKIRTRIKKLVENPPALLQAIGGRHILVLGSVLLRFNQQHHFGLLVSRVLYFREEVFEVKRHLARIFGDLLREEGIREGGREGVRE